MRRHQSFLAIGLVLCLAIAACSSSSHTTGSLSGAPVNIAPSTPSPADTGVLPGTTSPTDTTPPTGTTSPGTTSPTSGTGTTTAPAGPPITVTATIEPVADVTTTACPYTFTVTAKISVSRGPITLRYGWRHSDAPPEVQKITFSGSGPQTKSISVQQTLADVQIEGAEALQIIGHSATFIGPTYVQYTLICGATAEDPIATPSSGTSCPYTAEFSTNIRTLGPQDVTYEWVFSDGTSTPGDVNFTGSGPAQSTVFTFHSVPFTVFTNRFHASLHITSAGGYTTKFISPTCTPTKAL